MQSNSRVNNSRLINGRVNISRLNTSLHLKRKKPFTQPDNRTGEHQSSSERMDSSERLCKGGRGLSCSESSIYIYIYSPLKKLPTQGPLRGLPVNLRFTQGASTPPVPIPGPCTIPDLDRLLGTLIETLVISCTIRCQFMTSLL